MNPKLIQYRTHSEKTDENEALIRAVFAQLREQQIAGVRYLVLKQEDGTFMHLVAADPDPTTAALTSLEAFKRFQMDVKERCAVAPVSNAVRIVGNHRMLDDGRADT